MSFEDDVLAQPDALRKLAAHAAEIVVARSEIPWDDVSRIVLSGMGSSLHAGYAAWLHLVDEGWTAWTVDASELLHHAPRLLDARTLLVLVSQSGESAEVRRVLETLPPRRRPFVVGVTNTSSSTLAGAANVVVELHAGQEDAVSTKTCLNTLAALELLFGATDVDLEQIAEDLRLWLDTFPGHVREAGVALGIPDSVIVLGRGSSLASARISALIFGEATKIHAEAMSGGQFRHGPVELALPGLALMVLRGPESTAALQGQVARELMSHARVVWVGQGAPDGLGVLPAPPLAGDVGRLISEVAACEAAILATAHARGVEPGLFTLASKVTTSE